MTEHSRPESGYERIKRLAREEGRNIPDLLALARQNDPFFMGSPAQVRKAEWFASLWERFDYATGVHIRRVHYQLVSQESPERWDGKPYENTEECWNYLSEASKFARYLGLVDPAAFVDRRNPEPRVFMEPRGLWEGETGWEYLLPEWYPPRVVVSASARMPEFWVTGYDYESFLQPYHVEIWAEKSTMNDVLVPLCDEHAVNLVSGLGEMSITSVVALLGRVAALEKPCRILYVSDFDPAGTNMPVSVARKIEYVIETFALGADVRLDPLVLTPGQASTYALPRTPIKETDRRKGNFEQIHGEGAVELDALEALHPGELRRVVEEGIAPFRDPDLEERVNEAEAGAQEALDAHAAVVLTPHREELSDILAEVAAVEGRYSGTLRRMDAELAPLRERMEAVRHAVQDEVSAMEPDLPLLPEGDPGLTTEHDGWLFDSDRDYFEQLDSYKRHQGKGTP